MKFRALLFALVMLAAPAWAGSWSNTYLGPAGQSTFAWLGADSGDQTAIPATACAELQVSAVSNGGSPVVLLYLVDTATQTANTGTLVATIVGTTRTPIVAPAAGQYLRPTVTTGASGGNVMVKCAGYANAAGRTLSAPTPASADFAIPAGGFAEVVGGLTPAQMGVGAWFRAAHGTTIIITGNLAGGVSEPGTKAAVNWATTNYVTRLPWVQGDTGAVAGTTTEWRYSASEGPLWRGNAAGAGGFVVHVRYRINSATAGQRTFAGVAPASAIGNVDPSTLLNTIYLGNDTASANLSVCSNDGTAAATCTALGANFPAATVGAAYDFLFWASSNGSPVSYQVTRLDSAFSVGGVITTDLPVTTVQMSPHLAINNGASAASALIQLGQFEYWQNF